MKQTNTPLMSNLFNLPKYSINCGKQEGPFTTYEVCARLAPGQQTVIFSTFDKPKAMRVLEALNA